MLFYHEKSNKYDACNVSVIDYCDLLANIQIEYNKKEAEKNGTYNPAILAKCVETVMDRDALCLRTCCILATQLIYTLSREKSDTIYDSLSKLSSQIKSLNNSNKRNNESTIADLTKQDIKIFIQCYFYEVYNNNKRFSEIVELLEDSVKESDYQKQVVILITINEIEEIFKAE